jgi:hypothetical protein
MFILTMLINYLVFRSIVGFKAKVSCKSQFRGAKLSIFKQISDWVRMEGLEPPRLSAPDPKSGAATNYATCAGRCGQDYYCRASGDALFEVTKPNLKMGIGIDQIPAHIRNSDVLSGNDLGQLGNVEALPDQSAISEFSNMEEIKNLSAVFCIQSGIKK